MEKIWKKLQLDQEDRKEIFGMLRWIAFFILSISWLSLVLARYIEEEYYKPDVLRICRHMDEYNGRPRCTIPDRRY